jgi:small multidrug resistance pump
LPAAVTGIAYAISFYLMSLTLRSIPTGVAYAIWSGVGIVFITAIAWTFLGQKLGPGALAGMVLIVAGVVVLNLFSSPPQA